MSVICPRCGYEDDGTSFNCPRCFAVLQPDLVSATQGRSGATQVEDDTPGPVGRLFGRAGRRVKGEPRSDDTIRSAPAVGRDGFPLQPSASPGPGRPPYPPPPGGPAFPPPSAGAPGAGHAAPDLPGFAHRPMGSPDPPTYLWQAILATLFCCQPFGIVAIVFSAMTMSALGKGSWAEAVEHSNRARLWLWLAVLSGMLVLVLLLLRLCSGGGRLL